MTPAFPHRFESGASPRWRAVVAAELTMWLRDTNGPILLACVAAVCALLTPSSDASYAVITFRGLKPAMSAGTSVFAAGIVLSVLIFPICALSLGVGCARDRRIGTGTLFAASPVNPATVLGGRIIANVLLLIVFSLITLSLVMTVTVWRLKSLPDITSLAAYLLVVVPSGLCGLVVGAWLDRYLADHDSSKAIVTITLWSLLMVCSVVQGPDAFGLQLLKENTPGGSARPDFAVGIVVAEHMRSVPWTTLVITPSFLSARLYLLAVVIAGVMPVLALPGFLKALSPRPRRTAGGATTSAMAAIDLPRIRPSSSGLLSAALVIGQHWFKRGHWIRVLSAAALAGAILTPRSPRMSLSLALLVPLAIANARRISGDSYLRQFDLSTASLWKPSPMVFTSLVLVAAAVIPVVPLLVQLPLVRSIHIVVATAGLALWLTWACVGAARPLLGISVYALIWYFECFGDIPAAADLMAIGATSVTSFCLAALFTIGLSIIVLQRDLHAFRSSRYV